MNGPTWLYRVKVVPAGEVRGDFDVGNFYTVDVDEARRLRNEWADKGFGAELSSATIGDFWLLSEAGDHSPTLYRTEREDRHTVPAEVCDTCSDFDTGRLVPASFCERARKKMEGASGNPG